MPMIPCRRLDFASLVPVVMESERLNARLGGTWTDAELRESDNNGGAEGHISNNVRGGIDNWRVSEARGCQKSEGYE